jgi:hypothetical protein
VTRTGAARTVSSVAAMVSVLLLVAGCVPSGPSPSGSPSGSPIPSATPTPSATVVPDGDETAPPQPGDHVISSRISCNWRVVGPGVTCAVNHPVTPPIAAPPEPPVPYLYAIGEGTHPNDSPPYDQLSFRFKGGFPSYTIEYVSQLVMDGSGNPVALPGVGAILKVTFHDAQAHDENGQSTVVTTPPALIGHPAISRYAPAGDFEGVVTFGIGVGGSSDAGVRVPVRVYEVEKVELGQHLYVVAVQVDNSRWR